ncbi:hypothetical protein [Candidatus Burkholderia verschuerenii]|uniref:hypothetical protein n=1 Tax=Candidatus Burkholderia verschuerenii TaxID=242163 RepID=UPI001E5A3E4C|nr:hypothetical protein [Candidatus Burkholderia verschuerenii]
MKDSTGSRYKSLSGFEERRTYRTAKQSDHKHEDAKNRPKSRFFLLWAAAKASGPRRAPWTYWLAPDAGAAAEAAASEAAPAAEAASLAAAEALDAAAFASEAAAAGAEAAAESLAALGAAESLDLLHAARATAANRDATRRDFFMITSFYG